MCPGTTDNQVHQVRLVDFGTPHSFTELFNLQLVPKLPLKNLFALNRPTFDVYNEISNN